MYLLCNAIGRNYIPYPPHTAGYGIPKPPPTTYNMQSPGDSAISSGGPSGVTTKAPSALADPDDLEKIEPEEDGGDPSAHGYPPNTTRATGYPPSYPDQQGRGTLLYTLCVGVWCLVVCCLCMSIGYMWSLINCVWFVWTKKDVVN